MRADVAAPTCPAGETSLLDLATHFVSVYPHVGEAVWQRRPSAVDRLRSADAVKLAARPAKGSASDPEKSKASADARAKTRVRRLCSEHKLTRLLTLTCAPEYATKDRDVFMGYLADFRRWLNARGVYAVAVIEPHKSGNLHAHLAVGKWIDAGDIRHGWGRGFVKINRSAKGQRTPKGGRGAAVGRYLSKYIGKGFGDGAVRSLNQKRYTSTHGMAVTVKRRKFTTPFAAYEWMLHEFGSAPVLLWEADLSDDEWRGPPTSLWGPDV